jgi:hypothetical protein
MSNYFDTQIAIPFLSRQKPVKFGLIIRNVDHAGPSVTNLGSAYSVVHESLVEVSRGLVILVTVSSPHVTLF